ncbi:MAG: hypothetical protein ACLSCV_01255 [Acutalibacteraceae bacterium]
MDQDFLNENKEEQKTEQAPSQTENKEAAASQAVPTDVAEEKKEVQEDEKDVFSQSEQRQQTAEHQQQPQQQANHIPSTISGTAAIWKWAAVWTVLARTAQSPPATKPALAGQRPPYQPPYGQQPYQQNQQQPFYPYGEPQYPMYPQPNTGSNGL